MKGWIAAGCLGGLCVFLFIAYLGVDTELGYTKVGLETAKTELDAAKTELDTTKQQLQYTDAELEVTEIALGEKESELADLQISYEGLVTGHGYTIKDPTYREARAFLRRDKTDELEYVEGEYVCADFAADVCNNAEEEGIRCAYVLLDYSGGAHAIVAFNTIDRGLIYVEPQWDEMLDEIEIGEEYHECLGAEYGQPDYDDTIETIRVVW